MTSTLETSAGGPTNNPQQRSQPGTGHFMLTLCRLPGPVSIRPPQSPQLKPFTFFTSSEREPAGNERLYLHMGFFETLADAERWVEGVRGRFPDAIATIAPAALRAQPTIEPAASHDSLPQVAQDVSPVDKSLSDTPVLKILDTRGVDPGAAVVDEKDREQIALLRPEDTGTRHALKEAVAKGAPVSFAVQLQWSAQPLDLGRVPSLPLFKAHTLYTTEIRREGCSRYFLRLGFFADPISAKEGAAQVRSSFASAAVIPVSDQEVTRARAGGTEGSPIPTLVQQAVNRTGDRSVEPPAPAQPVNDPNRNLSPEDRALAQALKRLARREMWTNPDLLSESGVRHLKVKVDAQRRTSGKGAGRAPESNR
jgi:hypothetical protein